MQWGITLREDIFAEDIFANRGSLCCEFRGRYFRESRIESQFRGRYFREIRIEGQFREKYFRDFLRYDKPTTIISKSPHNLEIENACFQKKIVIFFLLY